MGGLAKVLTDFYQALYTMDRTHDKLKALVVKTLKRSLDFAIPDKDMLHEQNVDE